MTLSAITMPPIIACELRPIDAMWFERCRYRDDYATYWGSAERLFEQGLGFCVVKGWSLYHKRSPPYRGVEDPFVGREPPLRAAATVGGMGVLTLSTDLFVPVVKSSLICHLV